MNLRITSQTILANALANTQRHTSLLADLQEQVSTGLRLRRPSDDPLGMASLLAARSQDLRLSSSLRNIQDVSSSLNASESALQEASQALSQAQQIASEGANATNSPQSHEALAQEVDALIQRILDVANTQYGGRSLFAGTATGQTAFAVSSTDKAGRPLTVAYQGTEDRGVVAVTAQLTVANLYPGSQVF